MSLGLGSSPLAGKHGELDCSLIKGANRELSLALLCTIQRETTQVSLLMSDYLQFGEHVLEREQRPREYVNRFRKSIGVGFKTPRETIEGMSPKEEMTAYFYDITDHDDFKCSGRLTVYLQIVIANFGFATWYRKPKVVLKTLNCLQHLVVHEAENCCAIAHMEREGGISPWIPPLAHLLWVNVIMNTLGTPALATKPPMNHSIGLKTDVTKISGGKAWGLLAMVITDACSGKILGTFVVAVMCMMSVRESITLGLLMNTRGLVELIVLNIGKEKKVLNDEVFAILVLMALFTTFITTPVVMAIYKPARRSGSASASSSKKLHLLACVHGPRNISSLINLIESISSHSKGFSNHQYKNTRMRGVLCGNP
ncbi:Cation/H+ exchanger [Artemisia annua]|uniref:Cation/H+ exchanger n=1 Tax=Artemisia annua TaxID=35608 RepID=A0A2U1L843_ARTAN|nr:Cation/H+ exchanger [Artemisia annua]